MKFTFDLTTQTLVPGRNEKIVQNSQGVNYLFVYGVPSNHKVYASFTKPDKGLVGPISSVYDQDEDDVYCHVLILPSQANDIAGSVSVSFAIKKPKGTSPETYDILCTIYSTFQVYRSDIQFIPDSLNEQQMDQINTSLGNLSENKLEHGAIVGTTGQTIDKDTPVYSKDKADEELDKKVNKTGNEAIAGNKTFTGDNQHEGDNTFTGTNVHEGSEAFRGPVSADHDLNMLLHKILNVSPGLNAKDAVNFEQLEGKVSKTGNENIDGNKTFRDFVILLQRLTAAAGIDAVNQTIIRLANGVNATDAVNKGQMDTKVSTDIGAHNTSEVAHTFILLLIQSIQQEIARLDGRGKSYGEIPYTTAIIKENTQQVINTLITEAIQAGFGGPSYTPSNGDLVYDEGVGEGVNYHEWECSGEVGWVDNGAISSPKASNDIFGSVKGNEYVSIISGLLQVLKSDYAERLGVSGGDSFTYAQLVSYINATVDSMKLIQGVDVDTLTPLTTGQSVNLSDYDLVIADCYDSVNISLSTQIFTPSAVIDLDYIYFYSKIDVAPAELGNLFLNGTNFVFTAVSNAGNILRLTGIKFIDTTALNVKTTYSDTNFLDGKVNQDEVNRVLDVQIKTKDDNGKIYVRQVGLVEITYSSDGRVSIVDGDNLTVVPTYDSLGNISKITETFKEDSSVYETTFTKDSIGRVVSINKGEVI